MIRHIILLLLSAANSWAGTISLSVDGAAAHALKHNPELAVARLRIEEARARQERSGRLRNPELDLEFTRHTTGREGSIGGSLMQRFPLTSRLRHEKEVSRAELAAAEAEMRNAERKLEAEVRVIAVKILAFASERELQAGQLNNSRELADFLRKRVASGEAAAVDASQVELESSQSEIANLQMDAEEAVLIGELRPLLGISSSEPIKITGSLRTPGKLPGNVTPKDRPDIMAAKSRAEAADAFLTQQRASRWEDIGIGALYTRERSKDFPEQTETEHIVGFQLNIPLPVWNTNSGQIHEAEAAATRAEKEVEAANLTANAEAIAARGEMAAFARLIAALDDKVLPQATQIETQLQQNYSSGQTSLNEVLRARSRRLELQRQRLDALRDYHLAQIRHASATAQTPSSK